MLPDWQNVQRLLIHSSKLEVMLISPALATLRQLLPSVAITLMVSPTLSELASQLIVDEILAHEGAGTNYLNAERELALIELLTSKSFDAAIIFTNVGESPYPLAYICYLAGIPIRLGQSLEFGGSILSQWVKSRLDQVNPHLFLLESAGFPTPLVLNEASCNHYAS